MSSEPKSADDKKPADRSELYKKLWVLVVDDDSALVDLIVLQLRRLGFVHIETAHNGLVAYNSCVNAIRNNTQFDVIISDWRMPEMDGVKLLQRVRSNELMKDVQFMMLTARDDRKSIGDAIRMRVDQYMVKPFQNIDFDKKVELLTAKYG